MDNIQLVEVCESDIELEEDSKEDTTPKSKSQLFKECFFNKNTMLRLSALLIVITALACGFFLFPVEDSLNKFLTWMEEIGFYGVIVFIGIYILANLFFIPCSVLNLCAGFIFGLWQGFLYVWFGGIIGCLLSFLAGRAMFKYWASFFTRNFKMMAILNKTISRNSWKIMFLLRLSPVMPYNVLNYSLSLVENITLVSYTVTAALGMIPGTLLYVYFGTVARNINDILAGEQESSQIQGALIAVGLLMTIGVVVGVSVVAAKEIKKEMYFEKEREAKERDEEIMKKKLLTESSSEKPSTPETPTRQNSESSTIDVVPLLNV